MLNSKDYSPGFYKVFNELSEIERKYGSAVIKTIAAKLIVKFIWFRWKDMKTELIKEFKKEFTGEGNGYTQSTTD